MSEVTIYTQAQTLTVKEYRGQRVITFKDIDMLHQRAEGTARRNFNENKERFILGEDYFSLTFEEIRCTNFVHRANPKGLTLLTQMGYLMLAKSFNDDLAWHIQRQLVKNYFDTHSVNSMDTKNALITPNKNALETAYFNAINEALNEGYYLTRQRQRGNNKSESKLLGSYDGDFYYIISKRAYEIYANKAKKHMPKRGLHAYLANSGYLKENVVRKGLVHDIGINGNRYLCLAFYDNKVAFKK